MCGIVGVISKSGNLVQGEIDLFHTLIYVDAVRGYDSTGVFGVDNLCNVEWHKAKGSPAHLLTRAKYQEFAKKTNHIALVGHNRKATHGEVTEENAHPFVKDNIILVHNGVIRNAKAIADTQVDSEVIAHQLAEKNHEEALKSLVGAFAVAWYDINTKQLHLARNDERPMSVYETSSAIYFASEGKMMDWILERNPYGTTTVSRITKRISLNPGTVYNVNLEKKYGREVTNTSSVFNHLKIQTTASTGSTSVVSFSGVPKRVMTNSDPSGDRLPPGAGHDITFLLEDFKQADPAAAFEYILLGVWEEDPTVQIRVHTNGDDFLAVKGNLFTGTVVRQVWTKGTWYVWVDPNTLTYLDNDDGDAATDFTLNGITVTNDIWCRMPKKCNACREKFDRKDVGKYALIMNGRNRMRVYCDHCYTVMTSAPLVKGMNKNAH